MKWYLIFLPQLTNTSTLAGETWTEEIVLLHPKFNYLLNNFLNIADL